MPPTALIPSALKQAPILFILIVIGGCSSFTNNIESFNQDIKDGNYENAQTTATNLANQDNKDQLLWQLQAGVAARHNMDFAESNRLFDLAETNIKRHEEQTVGLNIGYSTKSVLIHDASTPYTPKRYDTIMVNTYKGLNYLALGNGDGARVEFNRAIDRQRRAGDYFAAEIKQEQAAITTSNHSNQTNEFNRKRTLNNPELKESIQAQLNNFPSLQAYPDFINPFTTYMAGLFAILDRDFNKASYLLKQTIAMAPDNQFIAHDFNLVERTLEKKKPFPPSVWIILENGTGPTLNEFRIDIPIFLVSNQILYSGIALPALKQGTPAVANITISTKDKDIQTIELSNMDNVINKEFKKRHKAVVQKALLSALLKSSMQYIAQKNGGDLALLATTIFQVATTRADTRIWTGLPNNFQIARLNKPQDNMLVIHSDTQTPILAKLPDAPFTLIYITISAYSTKPVMHIYSY